jgi:hypothetical protein
MIAPRVSSRPGFKCDDPERCDSRPVVLLLDVVDGGVGHRASGSYDVAKNDVVRPQFVQHCRVGAACQDSDIGQGRSVLLVVSSVPNKHPLRLCGAWKHNLSQAPRASLPGLEPQEEEDQPSKVTSPR